jgi:hypothetical protein
MFSTPRCRSQTASLAQDVVLPTPFTPKRRQMFRGVFVQLQLSLEGVRTQEFFEKPPRPLGIVHPVLFTQGFQRIHNLDGERGTHIPLDQEVGQIFEGIVVERLFLNNAFILSANPMLAPFLRIYLERRNKSTRATIVSMVKPRLSPTERPAKAPAP